MSDLVVLQNVSKSYGPDQLFLDLNLAVREGEKIGIVGPNGAGKSSLLKIIAGLETPDDGTVTRRNAVHIAYVPQMSSHDPDKTAFEVIRSAATAAGIPDDQLDAQVHVTLGKAGLDPQQRVEDLSGGWQKRLTLACGLVQEPDLLLLDEPTNHLDIHGVLWLQDMLKTAHFSWILVSHDRYFLDRTVGKTMELNSIFEDGYLQFPSTYTQYLQKREEYLVQQSQMVQSLRNKVKKETEWLQTQPKARTTKARFRVNAANEMIQELEMLVSRQDGQKTKLAFSASDRKTKKLIEAKGISKQFDSKLILERFDVVLSPKKRIGLLGLNGSGKTTLLKILAGRLPPDKGVVHHAPNLKIVYFDQNRAQLDRETTVANAISETGTHVVYRGREYHVIGWASRFGIPADLLSLPVSECSGGEQAKILIARLMLQKADVLLLDEPSNDLDIETLTQLEESLVEFPGAMMLVSHDRYMMHRVCTAFLGFESNGLCTPFASYEQWEKMLRPPGKRKKEPVPERKKTKNGGKRLSYLEQREFDQMEERIFSLETRMEEIRDAMSDPAIACDASKLEPLYTELGELERETDRLFERWAALESKSAP